MRSMMLWSSLIVVSSMAMTMSEISYSKENEGGKMSFFVSSTGLGKGGNLGGIEGADRPKIRS